ncbi:flagella synthesis protein FlgN [Noviherbaspirillum massiliense]|uniref:flagella synthesis protein FlgN n=1 Tax=Noviherbaspirillum massiliense TaxID=1465823 RepID=UPI000310F5D4|nr:flagellar protein FlgN [Noviherbaspirillum massiliense]
MSSRTPSPASHLSEEQQAARALLQLLQQEEACLVESDADGLAKLTGEKAQAVARMAELAARRYDLLEAAGFEGKEAGMEAWLEIAASGEAARNAWADLLAVARSAKELNRTNGLMIGQQLARNQSALNILQGGGQGASLYGPNGQTTTRTSSRGLAVG